MSVPSMVDLMVIHSYSTDVQQEIILPYTIKKAEIECKFFLENRSNNFDETFFAS